MRVGDIKKLILSEWNNMFTKEQLEAYSEKSEIESTDLDKVMGRDGVEYHSHSGFRDCDFIKIEKNKKYTPEYEDEVVFETFEVSDMDENTYYISLVGED